jgi:hypothetical protein
MTTVSNDVSFGRQTVRRQVNTRARSNGSNDEPASIEILCECGRRLCADRFQIGIEHYQDVLRSSRQYVVATHHDDDPRHQLVSRHGDFLVLERAAD